MPGRRAPYLPIAFLLACALALSACKKSGISRLEGHWRGSKVEGISPDQEAAAASAAPKFELEVRGDSLTIKTPKETVSSKISLVRESPESIVIKSDADGNNEETFTFKDEKTVAWKVDNRSITFTKDAE